MDSMETIIQNLSKNGYQYVDFLGKGGFSNVFLCYSEKYKREFAIKRAIKHRMSDYEYKNLIYLNHKNIIRLYDFFEDESAHYLVMDYCPNGTMKQKKRLSYEEFVYYAKQILEAVAYCHSQKIAHRDIKPDNIFLDQYNHIKLADFGMSKTFEKLDRSSDKCGTFKYFSPEMLLYSDVNPFKADIWALGVTFFYMATGHFPFESPSREKLEYLILRGEINFNNYDVNPKIQYLLRKMLTKSHDDRLSAEKLLDLPLFQKNALNNKLNGKYEIAGRRIQSSFNLEKVLPSDFNKNNNIEVPNKTPSVSPLSYKGINYFTSLRRLSSHCFPSKTF